MINKQVKYDSQVIRFSAEKYAAVILMIEPGRPNHEIVSQIENVDYETAQRWADVELAKIKARKVARDER